MTKIRTRYAPSPTGYFHIGGARTVILNYLYARHFNGEFVVRIEDTDQERNIKQGIASQLDGIKWLGIEPDESPNKPGKFGPYIQSKKFAKFAKLAFDLVKQKKAYYCFCTQNELEKARQVANKNKATPKYNRKCLMLSDAQIQKNLQANKPFVIRLKLKDNYDYQWNDLVRGRIAFNTSSMSDPIILKSNKIPTYNFGVVCDDHEMQITHILRAEEHISNTPYQLAIMEALGYNLNDIQYGHLSIVVDENGKKLSKRNKDLIQFIHEYQALGYYPMAIVNFLALLGWSPSDNHEIHDLNSLVKNFDPKRISKAPAFFDIKKMGWISSEYFKKISNEEYLKFIKPFIRLKFTKIDQCALIFKNQLIYAQSLNSLIKQMFMEYDLKKLSKEVQKFLKTKECQTCLQALIAVLSNEFKDKEIDNNNANQIIEIIKQKTGLVKINLYLPIRLAAIAKEHGPEMNKILSIVGKKQLLINAQKMIK